LRGERGIERHLRFTQVGVLIGRLYVKNAESLSLSQDWNAQVAGIDANGVGTACSVVASKYQVRMPGSQSPAGLRFE
jgi:hypothetical protein